MILKDGGGMSLGISSLKRGKGLSQWIWGDCPLCLQQVTTGYDTQLAPCLVNLCWRDALSTHDLSQFDIYVSLVGQENNCIAYLKTECNVTPVIKVLFDFHLLLLMLESHLVCDKFHLESEFNTQFESVTCYCSTVGWMSTETDLHLSHWMVVVVFFFEKHLPSVVGSFNIHNNDNKKSRCTESNYCKKQQQKQL